MAKTIFTRIRNKEITSVELKSAVLGRELYTYSNGIWSDAFEEFDYIYTPEEFCQYISDYEELAERDNFYLEILVGKVKHREVINLVKEKLTEFFSEYDYSFFPEFYKTLLAKEKRAAVLILSHSELFDYGCIPVMYPSTSELLLLWKDSVKKQKHKVNLLIPVIEKDCTYTINLFTGEVVNYTEK